MTSTTARQNQMCFFEFCAFEQTLCLPVDNSSANGCSTDVKTQQLDISKAGEGSGTVPESNGQNLRVLCRKYTYKTC